MAPDAIAEGILTVIRHQAKAKSRAMNAAKIVDGLTIERQAAVYHNAYTVVTGHGDIATLPKTERRPAA